MTGVEFAKLAVLQLMLAYAWAAGYAGEWRPVTVRAVVSAAFLLAGGFFLVMG